MFKKRILIIIPIVLLLIFYFYLRVDQSSKVVGWVEFENEINSEFSNIEGISWRNLTGTTLSIYVSFKRPYQKEDVNEIFLKIIKFLSNEASYNSLQSLYKERFEYSANQIIINFRYNKGDNSILSYYKSSSEMGGEDFTFESFKYWGLFYQGEYIKTYELPEK